MVSVVVPQLSLPRRVIVVVQLHEHYGKNNNNNFACICIIPDLINIYVCSELVRATHFAEHLPSTLSEARALRASCWFW